LNVGCIPTKTFARSAEAVGEMRNAEALGLKAVEPQFTMADIVARKDSVVEQLRQGIASVLSAPGITLVNAKASFVDDHTVEADGERYEADNIIIATGSAHKSLRLEKLDGQMCVTSDDLLSLTDL
ncbi:FAD-dependent oxidoreductase, partial [Parabacteroides distasonis]